ncbi:MAG: sirohydrochlorin chelatase [Vicinamibacterales bacterium]
MRRHVIATAAVAALALVSPTAASATEGLLLMAHGGSDEWNTHVRELAGRLDRPDRPVEVALGMASRVTLQAGIDALTKRGATEVVAVPLFISSHSSVIRGTEYLFGLRDDKPRDLEIFAKMAHGHGAGHEGHGPPADVEANMRPVDAAVPIRMAGALDHDAIVADILVDRARAISTDPAREAVILVAHGPVPDADNDRWLADMKLLAGAMHDAADFASIDYLTVRDDAPEPLRGEAAEALRALVSRRAGEGRRVLIVPLLLSYGGIEKGIRKRLDGLDYTMAGQGLMPDARLAAWVERAASTTP